MKAGKSRYMRQFAVLIVVFLLLCSRLSAQFRYVGVAEEEITYLNNKIDSLSYLVASGKATTFPKECLLPEHEKYFLREDNLSFSKYVLNLQANAKMDYVRMCALSNLAAILYNKKDYVASTRYWHEALVLAVKNRFDNEELHNYRAALNNNCFLAGDYGGAMKISTAGLEKAKKTQDKNRIAHFTNVIGCIHMKQENFTEAHKYFTLYLQQAKEMQDRALEAHALSNLGDLTIMEKDYIGAIRYFTQSLNTYQAFYKNEYPNNIPIEREAYLSDRLAETFKQMQKYKTALPYALIAVGLTNKAACNEYDIARYYINSGNIYNHLQYPDSALAYLRQGLSIAQRIKYREEIRNGFEQLALTFALIKQFDSAYIYQELFTRLKDSIASENNEREILQLETRQQIMEQQQLQQAELSRHHLWRNIIICMALFVILMLVFLYNRYRIHQKMKHQQQLSRQQNEMFNLAVSMQEKERKRIAEDIHDGLGSILSAAKLKLSSLQENVLLLTETEREKYQTTLALLDEASAELRNISHNIMPAVLSKLGLPAAIKNLADKIPSCSGLLVHFKAHGFENRIDESVEISIYRMILELINNIIKHAEAKKITIQLIKYPEYINILVEDDGKGFDYNRMTDQDKGIGLSNILSRVEYLKGTINADSLPGRGTTVIIDIPYPGNFQNTDISV